MCYGTFWPTGALTPGGYNRPGSGVGIVPRTGSSCYDEKLEGGLPTRAPLTRSDRLPFIDVIAVAWMSEAEQTEQAITGLIVLLLVVAALLAVLTVWYWIHTSPRRRARQANQVPIVDLDGTYEQVGSEPTMVQQAVTADGHDAYGPRI